MWWLFFALLSMFAYAATDLIGKKRIDDGNAFSTVEMLFSAEVFAFVFSLILFASCRGESGLAPWRILFSHPIIIANLLCFFMYWLLYLLCLRYIGLSLEAAVSGTNGILFFFALILVNAVSGKLPAVNDVLSPQRLIPVIFVLVFTFLLPNADVMANKSDREELEKAKKSRRETVIGLLILLFAMLFDTADTMITTLILDEGKIGVVDFLTATYFATVVPLVFTWFFLWKKDGRCYVPLKKDVLPLLCYGLLFLVASMFYIVGSSFDAVRTGIIFIAAPIFPIVGDRIFLKKRYSWRQNLCIWIITLAAIAFCAADYFK